MRRSILLALFAIPVFAAACGDNIVTAPGGQALANIAAPVSLDADINAIIDASFPIGLRSAAHSRWDNVKRQIVRTSKGPSQASKQQFLNLVDWIRQQTSKLTPPGGEKADHAAARLILDISLYFYNGADYATPVLTPISDVALGIVSPAAPATIVTPTQHAGVSFPAGAVSEQTVVVITQETSSYPDNCSGPLTTRYCQYPQFYVYNVFPDVRLNSPAQIAVCHINSGTTRRPLPGSDHDEYLVAHDLPVDPANYTTGATQIDGIEILPYASTGALVDCEHNAYAALTDPTGGGFQARTRLALSRFGGFVGRMLTPKKAYAIDQGGGGMLDFFSHVAIVDPKSKPDFLPGGAFQLSTIQAAPGETVTIQPWSVENSGTAASKYTTVVVLATDSLLTTGAQNLTMAVLSQSALPPQQAGAPQVAQPVVIPPTLVSGTYFLGVRVTGAGPLADRNPANDVVSVRIVVTAPVAHVSVAPATVTYRTPAQLVASLQDANENALTGRTVTWTSSDPAIATIDAAGMITGTAIGTVTATATSEGISGSAQITVIRPDVGTASVCPGITPGPTSFATIAEAVSIVSANSIIRLCTGVHGAESVIIDRPLTIEAENGATPVVRNATTTGALVLTGSAAATVNVRGIAFRNDAGPRNNTDRSLGSYSIRASGSPLSLVISSSSFAATAIGNGGVFVANAPAPATALSVTGSSFTGGLFGVFTDNAGAVTIQGTSFANHGNFGARVGSATSTISGNTADHCAGTCFTTVGGSHVVSGNTATACGTTGCASASGGQSTMLDNNFSNRLTVALPVNHHVILFFNGASGRIEHNTIDGCGSGQCITAIQGGTVAIVNNQIKAYFGDATRIAIAASDGQLGNAPATNLGDDLTITDNTIDGIGGNFTTAPNDTMSYPFRIAGVLFEGHSHGTVNHNVIRNTSIPLLIAKASVLQGGSNNTVDVARIAVLLTDPGSSAALHGNDFTNAATSIVQGGNSVGDLTCNWWGRVSGPTNPSAQQGAALYSPWSSGPVANGGGGACDGRPVATVIVTPASDLIDVGTTVQKSAVLKDASGNTITGRSIVWSSSNSSVASVNATGLVTGIAPGTVTITATSEGKSGAAGVTVQTPPPAFATITLTPTSPLIYKDFTVQMTATLRDAAGNIVTGPVVTWTSSNPAVATVSSTGLVSGIEVGPVTITASSSGKSASTSSNVILKRLAWNTKTQKLGVGQYQQGCCGFPVLTNVSVPAAEGVPVPVTITHSDPSRVTTPSSVTIPATSAGTLVSTVGAAIGHDVIIASAGSGYAPDTMVVDVGLGTLQIYAGGQWPSSLRVGERWAPGISLIVHDPNGGEVKVASATTFTLTPGPNFVFVDGSGNEITTVTVPANSPQSQGFFIKGTVVGSGTGTISHADYQTATTLPVVVTPPKLAWNTKTQALGVGQYQQGCCGFPVLTNVSVPGAQPAPVVVTITHSGLGRATTPASVNIAAGSISALVSTVGAIVGKDTIIASAPGIASDTMVVNVGIGTLQIYAGGQWPSSLRVGERWPAGISLIVHDPNGGEVKVATTTTFTLTPGPNFVFVDGAGNQITTIDVPANSSQSQGFFIKGTVTGSSSGTVSNTNYQTATTQPVVVTPAKLAWNTKTQTLAVGQYQQGCCGFPVLTNVSIPGPQGTPLLVTITHSNPELVETPGSVTIGTGAVSALVSTIGAATGKDTIIASAPGIAPDTMIVTVATGSIQIYAGGQWPASIRVGETWSTGVTLIVHDPNGGEVKVAAPTTFTLTAGPNFVFVDGAGNVITSITVPANSSQSNSFRIKGIAPGSGTGSVSQPNYQTTITLSVVVN